MWHTSHSLYQKKYNLQANLWHDVTSKMSQKKIRHHIQCYNVTLNVTLMSQKIAKDNVYKWHQSLDLEGRGRLWLWLASCVCSAVCSESWILHPCNVWIHTKSKTGNVRKCWVMPVLFDAKNEIRDAETWKLNNYPPICKKSIILIHSWIYNIARSYIHEGYASWTLCIHNCMNQWIHESVYLFMYIGDTDKRKRKRKSWLTI